jgi:polysaccharide export outer membrane protein
MLQSKQRSKHILLITLALTLFGAGCKSAPYVWVQNFAIEPVRANGGGPLTISAGDVVSVAVFGQENMSTKGEVRSDGTLAVPLVGQVVMAGQRPEDVALSLKERFKPYIQVPEVTVVILESHVIVSMVGEIKTVGVMEVRRPATVLQAIAAAGGLTEFADKSGIYVLRTTGNATTRIRFKWEFLIGADPSATQFRLKTGDVVVVE